MAREEDLWHCLHIQLIDTLSRTGVKDALGKTYVPDNADSSRTYLKQDLCAGQC